MTIESAILAVIIAYWAARGLWFVFGPLVRMFLESMGNQPPRRARRT